MNIKNFYLKCLKFYIPDSGGMINKFLQKNIYWSFYDKQKNQFFFCPKFLLLVCLVYTMLQTSVLNCSLKIGRK